MTGYVYNFLYRCGSISTCTPYEVDLPPGIYRFEAWGAQGGNTGGRATGGKGGYAAGDITLKKSQHFYIYVGSKGSSYPNPDEFAYNGGGRGLKSGAGGGATDFRLVSNLSNSHLSLSSRVLVAGGGGGADHNTYYGGVGGGLVGGSATNGGSGGSQDKGGEGIGNGDFGFGGSTEKDTCGGGGGYYGGGTGKLIAYGTGGGGGSGYVSGHPQAVRNNSKIIFRNIELLDGSTEKGKTGNGEARITLIGSVLWMTCKKTIEIRKLVCQFLWFVLC